MVETLTPSSSSSRWTQFHHPRRWIPPIFSNHKTLLTALWIAFIFSVLLWQRDATTGLLFFRRDFSVRQMPRLRMAAFNLTDFGGVGDGVTLNTAAFERTVLAISKLGMKVVDSSMCLLDIG